MLSHTVIYSDGLRKELGTHPSLSQLQEAVQGYLEQVNLVGFDNLPMPLKDGFLYVNEDGRARGLPPNTEASRIAARSILGNAVLALKVKKPKAQK